MFSFQGFLRQAEAVAATAWTTVSPVLFGNLESGEEGISALALVGIFAGFLVMSGLLARVWMGIMNYSLLDVESLQSIERRQPYLPAVRTIVLGIAGTALLVAVAMRTVGAVAPFEGPEGRMRAFLLLGVMAAVMGGSLLLWKRGKEYVFACISGTMVSFILIAFSRSLLGGETLRDPVIITLSVVAIILVWRFLFGPWEAHVKAAVLGTFVFWVAFHTLFQEPPRERMAHLLAIVIAAVPAVVWCALFLRYHRERLSVVLLMFFSGMVSTVPILFYDALVRRQVELQFFVFRVIPESFHSSLQQAIAAWGGASPLQVTLFSLFLTFLFVGLLEEGSKYWVLRRNGQPHFSSIDDAMQLAIVTAIGFAFAENITSTGYFFAFVKEFVRRPDPDWAMFLGNIAGRSILTSMVHIVSTGLLGYFLGIGLFLDPSLQAARRGGRRWKTADGNSVVVGLEKEYPFRTEMILTGLGVATLLHAISNFLVTLPEVLPGNPRTFGDLLQAPPGSFLHFIALLLVPSLLYVVGGFWLLTTLFLQKQNVQERGHLLTTALVVVEG